MCHGAAEAVSLQSIGSGLLHKPLARCQVVLPNCKLQWGDLVACWTLGITSGFKEPLANLELPISRSVVEGCALIPRQGLQGGHGLRRPVSQEPQHVEVAVACCPMEAAASIVVRDCQHFHGVHATEGLDISGTSCDNGGVLRLASAAATGMCLLCCNLRAA